jgi:hypothetical protein
MILVNLSEFLIGISTKGKIKTFNNKIKFINFYKDKLNKIIIDNI